MDIKMNADTDTNKDTSLTTPVTLLNDNIYSKSCTATKDLIQSIEDVSSSASMDVDMTKTLTNQAHHLLTIKEMQRALCHQVGLVLDAEIQQKRKDVESQSLLLQNLIYEKGHLEREINECERGFENVYLLQMAKDEMESENNDASDSLNKNEAETTNENDNKNQGEKQKDDQSKEEHDNDDNDELNAMKKQDAIINSFLQPKIPSYSFRDLKNHPRNLSVLHGQASQRGRLQIELTNASKRKLALMSELREQNKFLDDIPGQIEKLDELSIPLQDYFKKHHLNWQMDKKQKTGGGCNTHGDAGTSGAQDAGVGPGGVELMIGSERRKRLRHAKELSGPLYTLFLQFQGFLDAHCTKSTAHCDNKDDDTKNGTSVDNNDLYDFHDWKLHVIDCVPEENVNDTNAANRTTIDDIAKDFTKRENKAVQLWIPIPKINIVNTAKSSKSTKGSTKQDYVKLQFDYISKLRLVTVHVVGDTTRRGNTNINKGKEASSLEKLVWWNESNFSQLFLLHNLFENDDGGNLPHGCAVDLCFEIDEEYKAIEQKIDDNEMDNNVNDNGDDDEMIDYDDEESHKSNNPPKAEILMKKICHQLIQHPNPLKPYNWCQYLAGLHYPKREDSKNDLSLYRIDPTTKNTMTRLCRRVRSHATLSAIIKILKRKELPNPIPVHPSMIESQNLEEKNNKCRTKVDKWAEDSDSCINSDKPSKNFNVQLKRKNKVFNASLKIDPRYPAVPPVWSLQSSSAHDSAQSTSNATRNRKEEEKLLYDFTLGELENEVNTLKGVTRFLNDEVEESYDWVLMHQLRAIVTGWDEYQEALENNRSQDANSSTMAQRHRRGRDRRLICSLPFEVYKRGL